MTSRAIWLFPVLLACNPSDDPSGDTDRAPGLADNFGVEPDQGEPGCDHLLPDHCFYPFPSGAYVDTSGDRPRVVLPEAGMPRDAFDSPFSTTPFEQETGFGTASPVVFRWPGAADPGLPVFDPTPSLGDDAISLLIDATTGERIPHWVETDYLADEADPPVFVLRPSVPLPRGTTVVVGLRGWTDAGGQPLDAPEPFAHLRDGEATPWRGVHERRAHFEDVVFPTLQAAGFEREALQLAWSFPTQSAEEATSTLLAVRDAVFDALPAAGPDYTIDTLLVCDGPGQPAGCPSGIRVILDGTIHVPSAVLPADELGVRRLRRDAEGDIVVEGVEDWPFRLQLPHAAFTGDDPVPVLQYGHGFLGSSAEANNGWLRDMADRTGFAILATSMQGMNGDDASTWLRVLLADGGRFPHLQELAMQGVVNQLVLQRLVATTLAQDDRVALYRDDEQLAWDPEEVWYYGNSQGGSVGTVVMGTSLDVERGVLGVPGSGYPLLLHRSVVFTGGFSAALSGAYPAPDAVSRFLALLGTGWDRFDPLTFAPHIHGDPLPGTPDHEALLHVAKEDAQVQNEPSFILGRAASAVLMTPAVRPVWGLPEQPYPASPGTAVVEVDFGIPDDPTPRDPPPARPDLPDDGDTHGWLRRFVPAQDQMVHFLATGELIDVCDGAPCVSDGKP